MSESIRRTKRDREKEREWQTKRQEEWSHSSIGESAFLPYYSQPWQTDSRARDGADTHTGTENTQKNLISGVWRGHFPYREGENLNVRIYIKQIETVLSNALSGVDSVQYRFICSTGYSGNCVALQSPRIWPWPMSSAPAKQDKTLNNACTDVQQKKSSKVIKFKQHNCSSVSILPCPKTV